MTLFDANTGCIIRDLTEDEASAYEIIAWGDPGFAGTMTGDTFGVSNAWVYAV